MLIIMSYVVLEAPLFMIRYRVVIYTEQTQKHVFL